MSETRSAAARALLEETLAYLRADADDGPLFAMIERHLQEARRQALEEAIALADADRRMYAERRDKGGANFALWTYCESLLHRLRARMTAPYECLTEASHEKRDSLDASGPEFDWLRELGRTANHE